MYENENRRFAAQIQVPADVFSVPVVALELPLHGRRKVHAPEAFLLAANLLCRIFQRLHLVAPDALLGPNPWGIKRLSEIAPILARISDGEVVWGAPREVDIVLGIGAAPSLSAKRQSWISFSGWNAALDCDLAGNGDGLFGALFAACYGASQVFAHAAAMLGAPYAPIRPFQLSLLDYSNSVSEQQSPNRVDIGDTHLVGVGAVGSAMVYSLAHLPEVRGRLVAIDSDHVDDTNLQRYILMRHEDIGAAKVSVAAGVFRGTDLEVVPRLMAFADYQKDHPHIGMLVTPLDSEEGRRRVAGTLPKRVLNAATAHTKVTISRHGFGDGKACLHCLYLERPEQLSMEQRLARELGLAVQEVKDHLGDNQPVSQALAERIARHRGLRMEDVQPLVGGHLQSFYQRAVCGQASIQTVAGTVVSPLSFISAAAGILLAAELVKTSTPALEQFELNNYFRFDTIAMPNPDFRLVRPQDQTRSCICWDADYLGVYSRKYMSLETQGTRRLAANG